MWQVAAKYEVDDSRLINVEMAIDALESSEEPLSETEQRLLRLCKAAETQGLGDIVINADVQGFERRLMAKRLTQIHIHTQYAHRRPEKVYRRLSGVQAVKPNRHGITHQANIVYGGNDLRVYLNVEGQWHGYPFGTDLETEPKQEIG